MPDVTYCVVVPFTRDEEGQLVPGEAKEASNGEAARRRAAAVATSAGNVGAVAFSRTGDPDSGNFQEGVVLASFGDVDLNVCRGEHDVRQVASVLGPLRSEPAGVAYRGGDCDGLDLVHGDRLDVRRATVRQPVLQRERCHHLHRLARKRDLQSSLWMGAVFGCPSRSQLVQHRFGDPDA